MSREMKHVGNFLYQYRDNGTVAIAYKAFVSNLAGQMIVHEQMDEKAKWTRYCWDMVYDGFRYAGLIFENISEDKLIQILQA